MSRIAFIISILLCTGCVKRVYIHGDAETYHRKWEACEKDLDQCNSDIQECVAEISD